MAQTRSDLERALSDAFDAIFPWVPQANGTEGLLSLADKINILGNERDELAERIRKKEYYDEMRAREVISSGIPEKQRPFVAALLNQRDQFCAELREVRAELRKLVERGKEA